MQVTEVPAHTWVAEGTMDTLTGKIGFTVMVIEFEVAGLFVTQVAFEVTVQVTKSLLTGTYA